MLSESERAALVEELARARVGAGLDAESQAGSNPVQSTLRSRSCGDEVTVRVEVRDGAIAAIRWDGHGCVVSTAAASVLATLAPGVATAGFGELSDRYVATLDAGATADPSLGDAEVFAGIGRYPLRAGCASLAWRAARAALESDR